MRKAILVLAFLAAIGLIFSGVFCGCSIKNSDLSLLGPTKKQIEKIKAEVRTEMEQEWRKQAGDSPWYQEEAEREIKTGVVPLEGGLNLEPLKTTKTDPCDKTVLSTPNVLLGDCVVVGHDRTTQEVYDFGVRRKVFPPNRYDDFLTAQIKQGKLTEYTGPCKKRERWYFLAGTKVCFDPPAKQEDPPQE